MHESKRNLIYVPELSASTFLFYYYEGSRDSRSYSLRDYSQPGLVKVRYAREFPYTAGEILDLCARAGNFCFPAPKHRTDDLSFWHNQTLAMNERLNGSSRQVSNVAELKPLFPVLNLEQLMRHSKAKKRGDLQRIFTSANSEDYATWNVFQLLQSVPAEKWWSEFVALAEQKVQGISAELDANDIPNLRLWETVAAPTEYEQRSRDRMRQSSDPNTVQRSKLDDPVEGASEIDAILEGRTYVIFIEAKLNHDISTRTKHDVERNQISRNIDCLLEISGERRPFFWMIVRDDGPGWIYTQRINGLKNDPRQLLPHRPREVAERIVKNIAVLLWREVFEVAARKIPAGELAASVQTELRKRFGLLPNSLDSASTAPERDATVENEVTPVATVKRCACGCGLPVMKHGYVWGHKSGSRINTVPMTAKDLHVTSAAEVGKTSKHFAIAEMEEQIDQFKEKIAKLEEAIKILHN